MQIEMLIPPVELMKTHYVSCNLHFQCLPTNKSSIHHRIFHHPCPFEHTFFREKRRCCPSEPHLS